MHILFLKSIPLCVASELPRSADHSCTCSDLLLTSECLCAAPTTPAKERTHRHSVNKLIKFGSTKVEKEEGSTKAVTRTLKFRTITVFNNLINEYASVMFSDLD